MRWATSGRFTPAAATLTSSWPGPGLGVGSSVSLSTSGPPGAEMAAALIVGGGTDIVCCSLADLRQLALRRHTPPTMAEDRGSRQGEMPVGRPPSHTCRGTPIGTQSMDGLG